MNVRYKKCLCTETANQIVVYPVQKMTFFFFIIGSVEIKDRVSKCCSGLFSILASLNDPKTLHIYKRRDVWTHVPAVSFFVSKEEEKKRKEKKRYACSCMHEWIRIPLCVCVCVCVCVCACVCVCVGLIHFSTFFKLNFCLLTYHCSSIRHVLFHHLFIFEYHREVVLSTDIDEIDLK